MMTQERMDNYMAKNVSAIFSVYNRKTEDVFRRLDDYLYNTYIYFEDDLTCNKFIYIVYENNDYVEKLITNIDTVDIFYTDEYVILKCQRTDFISDNEMVYLENSKYSSLRETACMYANRTYNNSLPDTLQYHIINNSEYLRLKIQEYYNIKIENIYWKAYNKEKEVLYLSKLANMKVLGIREQWLLDQIENSTAIDKHVYEKVLANTVEYAAPVVIGLVAKEDSYKKMYENIQKALIDTCGKKQYMLVLHGSKHALLCNYADFKKRLEKVVSKYKLTDFDIIEKLLINHVKSLQFPTLEYFIDKNNSSKLATAYYSFDENNINNETSSSTNVHEL